MAKVLPYERRVQVLRLLAEHGPLSAKGIEACLNPTIHARPLRDVLRRLYLLNVLGRRYDRVSLRVFHQIRQAPETRTRTGEILGVAPESLAQPQFRHAELLHSEDCAAWTELLRRLFPRARVRRDYQFATDPDAQALLLMQNEGHDLLPDILFTLGEGAPASPIAVALEIERTAKSEDRLLLKLRKYAERTRIDGLIYVCSQSALQEKLVSVYKSKVLERALRINHYGKNFYLFADGSTNHRLGEPLMFNSDMEAISLRSWLSTLAATKGGGRYDSRFQPST